MSDKDDGTRMIHGECRLEATSPGAHDISLNGLRLHLDLHIMPRAARATSNRGWSAALAIASVRASCSGILMRRERALVAGIGISVSAIALLLWSMRGPSGSHAPSNERSAAPSVAEAPGPSPLPPPAAQPALPPPAAQPALPPPAAQHPLPPPGSATALRPELVPLHAGSSALGSGTSPAPNEEAVTRKPATARKPAPESLGDAPPRAATPLARPAAAARAPAANAAKPPRTGASGARNGVATFAAPPAPPERSTAEDLLDLFGDTK